MFHPFHKIFLEYYVYMWQIDYNWLEYPIFAYITCGYIIPNNLKCAKQLKVKNNG